MALYSRPEQILVHFRDLLEAHKGLLGLQYVGTHEELLIPEYPAVDIMVGMLEREDHGTQRFLIRFTATFWLYHANFEATHATRTLEDMELATKLVRFLHTPENRRLDGGLITGSGRVVQETPGILSRGAGQGGIIATRLLWQGMSQVNYEDS